MKCQKCQNLNPDGARFCSHCGTPLSLICSNCGTNLQPDSKFCHQCGHPVSSTVPISTATIGSPVERSSEEILHRYIPKELLAKLEAARSNRMMEGERRVVTILFCDVQDSTQAASQLDPEEWAEIINGAFEHMIQPIYRYEGTVARLQGDGLLAFFGAPIAHEDDPERAVMAGLEIISAIQPYSTVVKSQWDIEVNIRVGINTGLVVVGEVGSDLRVEYSALGDAINLAAKMEQHAQPGTVLIAEPTYKLIAPLFEVETIENLSIKGHTTPTKAYRPISRKAQPGSLRGLAGISAPLIGRKVQLDTLWSAIEELGRGQGQIISVIGEAGLGKSRLITELRKAIQQDHNNHLEWLEGRALSYDTAIPFAPFITLFTTYFTLQLEENDRIKYKRISEQLATLDAVNSHEIAPYIASILDLHTEGNAADRTNFLTPPQLREKIFTQVAKFLEILLATSPVILYIDDLHWSDPTSIGLLQSLLSLTDKEPLLIIAAFRPRQQELSWEFHQLVERDFSHKYQVIHLNPLDSEQARELVANLLEIDDLPEKVRAKILEKSEGNPFYVEEVIRSLLDNELVVRIDDHWQAVQEINEIHLPDTLVGVITARLDRLDEMTRQMLQAAAVVGRDFNPAVLEKVVETPDLLEDCLVELQRRELIREKSSYPQRTFTFKHVLTQEAAYRSILLSNRRELHRRTAETLILQLPEAVADIARHLLEARMLTQALPYLVQAGDRAAKSYATEEAIDYYRQALKIKDTASSPELIRRSYEGLGSTLLFANHILEAKECFQEMLDLAITIGDIPMEISAINKLASITALHLGNFPEAEKMLIRADDLAHTHHVKSSIPETNLIRCQMCTAQADFDNVVKVMGEVVQVGEELGSKKDIVLGLEHVSTSLVYLTEFEVARQNGERGLKISREIGDRREEAWLLSYTLPLIYLHTQRPEDAVNALQEGLQIASMIGARETEAIGSYLLSEISRWRGEYQLALQYGYQSYNAALPLESYSPFLLVPTLGLLGSIYQEISTEFHDKISEFHLYALRLLESPLGAMTGGIAWADLGHCAIAVGDLDIAQEVLNKGLHTPNMMSNLERPRHISGAALLESIHGNPDEALRLAEEAYSFAQQHNLRYYVPFTLFILGKIQIACNEVELGLETLQQARNEAEMYGMRPIIWQLHAAAVDGYINIGNIDSAEIERSKAKALVREIADDFENQELRDAFLRSALAKIH